MIENVPFYQIDLNSNFNINNNEFNNIKIKVYENNETMLKRTEELEEIKNISNTVYQLSDDIKIDVNKQEENLNYIEENVENVNENSKKGKSKKKFLFLCIIIIFIILLILYLLFK